MAAFDGAALKCVVLEVCGAETLSKRRVKAAEEIFNAVRSNAISADDVAQSNVIAKAWQCAGRQGVAAADLVGCADAQGEALLPSVLGALTELALIPEPALIGQNLAALRLVLDVAEFAARPGAGSERASADRLALVAALRWLAAVSTHPVTQHLLRSGVAELIQKTMSLRTDDEVLLHAAVLVGNIAADGPAQCEELCRAKLPRLVARLVAEPHGASEVKEQLVTAANALAHAANVADGAQTECELVAPLAFAKLASSPLNACAEEGVWALHLLQAKGSISVQRRLANMPAVVAALERLASVVGGGASPEDQASLDLAKRIAALTLGDLRKLAE
ncbi:hypothetical protein M885DRAFT_506559 [Pelagophyceae sp. CCMP2097]|nr:hypothetical protein M885DRAFT_506559 [Pelagophyceae sp. CCMP2097]|mmetsp:Transcript_32615/g.112856  ORF Transcript_32615/g.112856 Transcript_32615/m.112856 type:complete len:335 (-) Transcript_32615:52-1056(-)